MRRIYVVQEDAMWSANQGRPRNPWCLLPLARDDSDGWMALLLRTWPIGGPFLLQYAETEYGILCTELLPNSLRLVLLD